MVRIGIILSVLWFFGFGGYTWFSSVQQLNDIYSRDLQRCSQDFDRTQNSVNYEYCLEDAQQLHLSTFDTYKAGIPRLLAIDFGVIAFCWAVGLLGIVIMRIMRRVFRP
jgi:hypothetical protein